MEEFFNLAKEFVSSYIVEISDARNVTGVGVIVSSTNSEMAIPLRPVTPIETLLSSIRGIKYRGQAGHLEKALTEAKNSLFKANGPPSKILIVITDGVQVDKREAIYEASRALHRTGVLVYVIGMGKTDYGVLRELAGGEQQIYVPENLTSALFVKEMARTTQGNPGTLIEVY